MNDVEKMMTRGLIQGLHTDRERLEARVAELDNQLRWITAFAWHGSDNPRIMYDPIYIKRAELQQLLTAGGYTPDKLK